MNKLTGLCVTNDVKLKSYNTELSITIKRAKPYSIEISIMIKGHKS